MQKRPLGNSGLSIAPIAFGGNVFGWTADEAMSFRILDRFVDAGFNLVDTADVYSRWAPGNQGGESETIIGRWLKQGGRRDKVLIATKVGMEMGPGKKGLSPAYIRQAAEDSLRRLQIDTIDLYQSHEDDAGTPLAETLEAYDGLIKAGKVRAIGASNYSAQRLEEALRLSRENRLPRYECLQPLYNLYDREKYEAELEPLCRREALGVIGYGALAGGFLTGKYRSEADFGKSPRGANMARRLNDRGRRILAALDDVAARHSVTPAQVSLAWLIARPGHTAPIASATSLEQLDDLLAAATLKLDAAAIAQLDAASAADLDQS